MLKRDVLTSPGVNAIRQSNVSRHIPDRRYPVATCNRVRLGVRNKLTDRENSNTIIRRLRTILSFLGSELHAESKSSVLETLEEFIKEDDRDGSTYRYRWSSLLKEEQD